MPLYQTVKTKYRKKKAKSVGSRKYNVRRVTLNRYPVNKTTVNVGKGFPKKLVFTHKYNDLTTGTTTAGVPSKFLWSCNGLYDPYATGSGFQPFYFDQLTALYNHYVVIGSRATITVTPTGSTVVPCCAGMFINDDTTTTPAVLNDICEQSKGRYKNFNNQSGPIKFTLKWSAKKTFGGNVLANNSLTGTAAANPTEQCFYTFFCGAMDQVSTQTFVLQIAIEYIAVWKELKDIAGS